MYVCDDIVDARLSSTTARILLTAVDHAFTLTYIRQIYGWLCHTCTDNPTDSYHKSEGKASSDKIHILQAGNV